MSNAALHARRVAWPDEWRVGETEGRCTRLRWSSLFSSFELFVDGDVAFESDGRRVRSLSSGGLFEIRHRRGLVRRRLRVIPTEDGGVEHRFFLFHRPRPFGPRAQDWLAGLSQRLLRSTGVGAEARAREILESEGPERLLDGIPQLENDRLKVTYLEILLEEGELDRDALRAALPGILASLDADHDRLALLSRFLEQHDSRPSSPETQRAIRTLESDFHRYEVLLRVLARPDIEQADLSALADLARELQSDHYKGEILRALARRTLEPDAAASYLSCVGTVDSDHYLTLTLQALVRERESALTLVGGIDAGRASDLGQDRAELLRRLSPLVLQRQSLRAPFFGAVRAIRSEHRRSRILRAILELDGLDEEVLGPVIEASATLHSDHHRATVLSRLPRQIRLGEEAQTTLVECAAGIEGEAHLARILALLLERPELSDRVFRRVLDLAEERLTAVHHRERLLARAAARLLLAS